MWEHVIYRSKGLHERQAQDQGTNHAGHEARQRLQESQAPSQALNDFPPNQSIYLFLVCSLVSLSKYNTQAFTL